MPDTVCRMCGYDPDCVYDGWALCYLCVSVLAKFKREAKDSALAGNCQLCNDDKACVYCIDDELYGAITTTQQGQLPAPPESITLNWCIGSHQGCECPNCHGGC